MQLEVVVHRDRPEITQTGEELKELLKQETHPHKRQRLHALYLFATGQARTRQQAAALLGLHRETIGRWLACYSDGGLAALLDVYVPAGKSPSLPEDVIAELQHKLKQSEGFASYAAMHIWLTDTYHITIKPKTLEAFVRRRFGARPKVARPSNPKKTMHR